VKVEGLTDFLTFPFFPKLRGDSIHSNNNSAETEIK